MSKARNRAAVAATVLSLSIASTCHALIGSDGSGNAAFTGTDIGAFLGDTSFYNAGYTGSGVIIANIEAGYVWNGHETTDEGQVAQYFSDSSVAGQFDRHATWVGHTMVGEGSATYQRGIAYGATLWSGAIATSFNSAGTGNYSTSFSDSTASLFTAYYDALVAGVNGKGTADVLNSSYGSSGGQSGNSYGAVLIDALTSASGKLICISAGNSGPTTNTVGDPASGFNGLVVGATGNATTGYTGVASFSSVSPTDVYNPTTNTTIAGARARIDIVAPGTSLTLAYYGGATGGNSFGGATSTSTTSYSLGDAGTSFSSPIVAASAALIVNAGKSLYISTNSHAIDARVIKAVMMNSATQLSGYNNGQTTSNGIVTTTQSLDYTQGAGQLNMAKAYTQYTTGTTGTVSSTGGAVSSSGWAYGSVAASANASQPNHNDYTVSLPTSIFTLTLDWFAHEYYSTSNESTGYGAFDNLDLKVFELVNSTQTLVAQSTSTYNSDEHLSFVLPSAGTYTFSVYEDGFLWNGDNGITDTSTPYGIAWNDTVPEPTMIVAWLSGTLLFSARRRKRN